MQYYDHAMVGATVAVAAGAQRRFGWPVVVLAALAGMFPDWDALFVHTSPDTYRAAHRTWGHNVFAVTLAGIALGFLGYAIHRSTRRNAANAPPSPWIALAVVIMWTHPLLDMLYCGLAQDPEWAVAFLWPLTSDGLARPWMPWTDWGGTLILSLGLAVVVLVKSSRQASAAVSLGIFIVYVGVRGALTQW